MIIDITNSDAPNVAYWKAERFIVKWTTNAEEIIFGYQDGAEAIEVARYKPANGAVLIDVTDFVRTYPERNLLRFSNGVSTWRGVIYSVAGLINPAGVYIPPFEMPDALIVPPERILYAGITNIRCEFYPTVTTGLTWELAGTGHWGIDKRWIDTINDFTISRIKYGEPTVARKSTFQSIFLDPCKSPAVAVRWVSFTGVQRVHHFLLRKPTIESAENYQLLTLDNSYNEIKGRVDGFDLYLDDLLPYDLWYYADVVTSSKVEVSLDGQNWHRVQVTTKNVTIPTGTMGDGKLEITVNWRRYDAVTM